MSAIAIIPARGGSKRIPRKNIRLFSGRPIIEFAIGSALQSGLFNEVMVSTEDDEVAAFAGAAGASVPFRRSQETAGDQASTVDVLLEVLAAYDRRGRQFDYGCCIYPTAPFVTVELLRECWELMVEQDFDAVFPVLRYSYPVQRSLRIQQGRAVMTWPEHYAARSQDLEPLYHDAGQFYCFRVRALRDKERLFTDNAGAVVISELSAHDIDTPEDWAVAEFKYRYLMEAKA